MQRPPERPTLQSHEILKAFGIAATVLAIIFYVLSSSSSFDNAFSSQFLKRRILSELGDSDAQYKLGEMYLDGGGSQSKVEASYWLSKSANSGNPSAQSLLGALYFTGDTLKQDYTKAFYWMLRAAKQGDMVAQSNLGVAYYYGYGTAQDLSQALKWYRISLETYASSTPTASNNSAARTAMEGLGHAHLEGWNNAKKDGAAAEAMFQKAAKLGSPHAMMMLYFMYDAGDRISRDAETALKWLKQAAASGYRPAQQKLQEVQPYHFMDATPPEPLANDARPHLPSSP